LREKYAGQIKILIGFEGEWIRPSYGTLIRELASNPLVDFYIGSVHHVHGIPIDYDATFYRKAREVAGGSDERLFEDYFDAQFEMLNTLRPKVVGHLDLIRLWSDEPNRDLRGMKGVWEKVVRNLKVIVGQGGLMEVNISALRKGLEEPYPTRSVCEEFLEMGGLLTLSDDSHGIAQVGTNYERAIGYLESLGVKELYALNGKGGSVDSQVNVRSVTLASVKENFKA
jgi:histidinol-phosphatase (PHP family)